MRLPSGLDPMDRLLTGWMARHGIVLLRISLGVVFLWFGALKFFPGLSPAQDLASRTIASLSFGVVQADVSVPLLAAWECAIGLGLIAGVWMRAVLFLLFLQMLGTLTPVFLFPAEVFVRIPYAPTLEMKLFFIVLTLSLAGFFLLIARSAAQDGGRAVRVAALGIALWLALTAALATQGFYRDFATIPPRIAFAVLPAFATVVFLSASPRVRRAISRVPAWWLILAQAFRLPLEIALHRLYVDGVIPREMTYEGLNFDVVTGVTAPIAAYIVWRGGRAARAARIAWNVMGLALVLTITIVSILCTPSFLRVFTSGPANTFVAEAPFIWLPAFIVPSAILLHVWALSSDGPPRLRGSVGLSSGLVRSS